MAKTKVTGGVATGMVCIALQDLSVTNPNVEVVEWNHMADQILAKFGGELFLIKIERVEKDTTDAPH